MAAFQEAFKTLVAVYQAWTESGRGLQQESKENVYYDEELVSLSKAFAGLNSALQACPADCLFQPALQLDRHMPDVLRCCEAQARAARHAVITSLQENVRTSPSASATLRWGRRRCCLVTVPAI